MTNKERMIIVQDALVKVIARVTKLEHDNKDKEDNQQEHINDRVSFLEEACKLIVTERQDQYGEALDSFQRIAGMWEAYLNAPIDAVDVANMMVLLKTSRSMSNKEHADSYVDMAGYAALAGEMATMHEGN